METEKFVINFGIASGYNTNFTEEDLAKEYYNVRIKVQDILKDIFEETGVYVSCYSNLTSTIYNMDWGCPLSGEGTVTLSGTCNAQFTNLYKWHSTVVLLASRLKKEFKQSTITVEFMNAKIEYLNC